MQVIDWNIAPSDVAKLNPELLLKMSYYKSIKNPFVFSIDDIFSFKEFIKEVSDLALNIQRHVMVTEYNISVIYDYFINKVVKNLKIYMRIN